MPPEWMWSLTEELEDWFAEVEQRHKDKYGDNDTDDKDFEDSSMVSNDLAKGRGRNR